MPLWLVTDWAAPAHDPKPGPGQQRKREARAPVAYADQQLRQSDPNVPVSLHIPSYCDCFTLASSFSKGALLVTYSSADGYSGAVRGPHGAMQSSPYGPPQEPQASGALAVVSFITGLIAFLCGWVPFLGLALGALGLLLAILAVRKPTLRGLAVAGIVLSALATVASIVTTGFFVLAIAGSSGSSSEPVTAGSHSPEDFTEIDERTLSGIAKEPDAHAGETLILYGYVTQFDANTGPCTMRLSVSAAQGSSRFDYEHNSLAYSGDGDSTCPELDDVIADDEVKLTVILQGGKSYNSIGGDTTVPYLEVVNAEVL